MIAALLLATLLDVPWKAIPASGVDMKLTQSAQNLRVDFDFQGHGGYAISRRDGKLELPDNFELAFRVKGDAPRETLEVKFVQGDNVWWSTRREFDFPTEWRRVSVKKRQVEFAWGPIGPSPLPKTIDAIEIVVTAGTGGKGTVWIDDVQLLPLDTVPGPPPAQKFVGDSIDLGARYEIGGVVLQDHATSVQTSIDGERWETRALDPHAMWVPLFDTDARYVRAPGAKTIRVLPPMKDDNEFFAFMAKEIPPGLLPRYLRGQQSYWTILGGTNGEEEEALFSEDGAIEVGHARFSVEPFLVRDGNVVTWVDASIEQREGPQVVWKNLLSITPRYDRGILQVRYQLTGNAKLLLAIRPFQVNTPWQFLNRTGGVVRVKRIAREGDAITVDADQPRTITVPKAHASDAFPLPESLVAGDYESALLAVDGNDVTIEIPLGPVVDGPRLTSTFSLDLPAEPRIAKTIAAQRNYILINKDGAAIHPGSRSYERSWIRDGSLTSEALLRLGEYGVVREYIEWYAKSVRDDGYVPCCVSAAGPDPVPEHDSHGQFLYLVAEYYRHTGDRALVERMLPTIRRIVAFIDKLRHERMTPQYANTVFYGLVPESISHEGYSAKPMHSYWDDLFILKGLKDAEFLTGEKNFADEFRRDLLNSIQLSMQQHHIDYIPGAAELGDFDATSTTVAVTPVDAKLPAEALERTFARYWEHALEPRTYTPYELRVLGTLVRLGQAERARQLLARFFEDQRPAAWYQWAEVVRANQREPGFIGDMPHTWVGSDFIRSALDMLAYEEDGALVIGAGISKEWARKGLRVRNLSTHYGLLSYEFDAKGFRIHDGLRMPPNGIVVRELLGCADVRITRLPMEIPWKEGS